MFLASKLLSFFTQPLAWAALLLFGALLCLPRRRRSGMRLGWLALAVLLLQGWEPLPEAVLRQLEAQYPEPAAERRLGQYAGIVVLGGALESARIWQSHGQVPMNDAAERMTVPISLLRQEPHLRLLFTGGEGNLLAEGTSEAALAKAFFDSMGVPPQQVVYESASRTTYENAVFSAALPGVDPRQPWLLLTSAFHMPRSVATFRKAGWNVTPYPVDFRTGDSTAWTQYSLWLGAEKWQLVLHELAGLLAYRLAGRA